MRLVTMTMLAALLCAPPVAESAHVYFDDAHDNDGSGLTGDQSNFAAAVVALGHTIEEFSVPITFEGLISSGANVLMLFDPDTMATPLSQDEITAIHQWLAVDCCRGLWVVGGKPLDFQLVEVNNLIAPFKVQFLEEGIPGDGEATFVGNHPTAQVAGTVPMFNWGVVDPTSVAVCLAEDADGRCVASATNLYPIEAGRLVIWGDATSFKNDRFDNETQPLGVHTGLVLNWLSEVKPLTVEESSWGSVKAIYR